MRNKFNPVDTTAQTPADQPHRLDECAAADKKARRGILAPSIQDGRRVAVAADEVGANHHIIYDDKLGDEAFAEGAKDFLADRDAIAAAGLRANSDDYFPSIADIPYSIWRPEIEGVSGSFLIWEKRPTLSDADTSISTQHDGRSTTAYVSGPPKPR